MVVLLSLFEQLGCEDAESSKPRYGGIIPDIRKEA
jgi:hypothetical protein